MLSCSVVLTLCDSRDCSPPGSSVHGDSPGKNTGVGCHAFLQRIFPTQGLNPGLSHCRWILYQLSHKGSPRILEWVAYPFSSGSSQPRNWTRVFCTAGGFFTNWAMSLLSEPSGKPQQRPTAAKKKKKKEEEDVIWTLYIPLLTLFQLEVSHVTIPTCREAARCSLW